VSNNDSWAPGWGRSRRTNQPRAGRPGLEVDHVGELDHPGAVTAAAVAVDGGLPAAGRDAHDAVTNPIIDRIPEAVVDVALDAFGGQPVRRPGGVSPAQQVFLHLGGVVTGVVAGPPRRRQLADRVGEHGDVISRVVRSGVARTQAAGEHLVGLGTHRQHHLAQGATGAATALGNLAHRLHETRCVTPVHRHRRSRSAAAPAW
jgi:hypothetical protein